MCNKDLDLIKSEICLVVSDDNHTQRFKIIYRSQR